MKEAIQHRLNDSAVARWTALILVASMMFFAYMFVAVSYTHLTLPTT